MSDDTVLDTTFRDPIVLGNEVDGLMFALDRVRAQFAWKVSGLDATGLNKRHPPSTMTLAGLVKHLALVEDYYLARDTTGEPPGQHPDAAWQTAADHSPAELYALWRGAVERSRTAWARVLAHGGLDQPSAFAIPSGERPDLIREAVDGLVGNDPPQ